MAKTLTKYVNVNGTMYAPGDKLSKEVADAITNPKAFEDNGEDEGPKALVDMNADELKAELASRNASRSEADAITPDGNSKAKVLEALQADDAAQA